MDSELFKKALTFVLIREGGYVNDPNDPGGATNKGITQRTYNAYRTRKKQATQDVKNITDTEVREIYYNNYWLAAGCHKMTSKFAVVCFDTAVNMGVSTVKPLLEACQYDDLNMYLFARIEEYNARVKKNRNLQRYLHGWLNRVFILRNFIRTL